LAVALPHNIGFALVAKILASISYGLSQTIYSLTFEITYDNITIYDMHIFNMSSKMTARQIK